MNLEVDGMVEGASSKAVAGEENPLQAPFLTVMIPAYNAADYLAQAMECILKQPCRDLELLVLNDGSTDNTLDIAREFQRRDPRVVIDDHPNMGLGANRNHGFRLVRGTWLMFLDHDDLIAPNFYCERTKEALQALLAAGVETLVPSRIYSNEEATRAFRQNVPLEGVFDGAGPASLQLNYEFATMLYSVGMLRRNNVAFCETRPEMESIYRHQAVFCSNKVLFTNNLWFAIRRDNPQQITKNWDWPAVARVRAEQYAKLVDWHRDRGTTGEVLEQMEGRARQAKVDAQAANMPAPRRNVFQRMKDRRQQQRERERQQREREQWLADMLPMDQFLYTDDELSAAWDKTLALLPKA